VIIRDALRAANDPDDAEVANQIGLALYAR
jgi:hypothetical protein